MWEIATPEQLHALASRLAAHVSFPDFIALDGELGAGKTVFAQGLLSALGVVEEVTSPTYQLVHSHSTPRGSVHHCDFYRVPAEEQEELGFSELCSNGIVVAEWAALIAETLPENRLEVHIAGEGPVRTVQCKGFGAWQEKIKRFQEISSFLETQGWGDAVCIALKGDASARQFSRLRRGGETAMLMDWPLKSDGPPIRNGRPYCEIAHLAREGRPFVAIGAWLRERAGLSAPQIFASDAARGFYLVEDLGDGVFGRLIGDGASLDELYSLAVDGQLAIRAAKPANSFDLPDGKVYRVPEYDSEALSVEIELVAAWFFKLVHGRDCEPALAESLLAAWSPSLDWLETQNRSLLMRDFHSPNLLLCPERNGVAQLGVIDFQDAVWGHPAYDLVSLLQDARVDVPEASEAALFARYCAAARDLDPNFDEVAFGKAYAILGAQRNTKILGIFARLSLRDGKHDYLRHLPRIMRYLVRNLAHPELKTLKAWYQQHLFAPLLERSGAGFLTPEGLSR